MPFSFNMEAAEQRLRALGPASGVGVYGVGVDAVESKDPSTTDPVPSDSGGEVPSHSEGEASVAIAPAAAARSGYLEASAKK